MNWETRKFEIGYWMDSRYTKKGYMTEAVELLTNFTFNELLANRVEIRCDPKNINSRRIPERLGYTLEGTLRHDSYDSTGTSLRDTCIFSKIRNDL
jgi:RimJ/RimL family protein N-acetyltransferase